MLLVSMYIPPRYEPNSRFDTDLWDEKNKERKTKKRKKQREAERKTERKKLYQRLIDLSNRSTHRLINSYEIWSLIVSSFNLNCNLINKNIRVNANTKTLSVLWVQTTRASECCITTSELWMRVLIIYEGSTEPRVTM